MRAALAIGATTAALVGGATTVYAAPAVTSSSVRLRAEHSDKCLTVSGSRLGDAYAVQQSCADDLDNQLFELRSAGEGMISVWAKHSGRCLGLAPHLTGEYVVQLWCVGAYPNERWRVMLVEVAKGLYELRSESPKDYCMTIPKSSQAEGESALVQPCTGAPSQRWRIQSAAS
ncbi:RICIN domain-containing protein [Streptomyces syringium]|uniref:RICIN domain-containing protein n=1 Tax=Streptomyces syringium TaxID=76729 RepID=UPI003D8FBC3C